MFSSKEKMVVLRFISDNTFFGALMAESEAKELISKIGEKKLPSNLVGDEAHTWVVDLDRCWAAHIMEIKEGQGQGQQPLPQEGLPWRDKTGRS